MHIVGITQARPNCTFQLLVPGLLWRGRRLNALHSFTLCFTPPSGSIVSDQIFFSILPFDVPDPVVEVHAALEDAVLDRQVVLDQRVAFATGLLCCCRLAVFSRNPMRSLACVAAAMAMSRLQLPSRVSAYVDGSSRSIELACHS